MAGVRRGDTKPRVHYTQSDKDHFLKEVDAYVKPGDTNSGLLPYLFRIEGLANGQGDKKIQAYNYRVCLTTDPQLRIPIEKPAGYREIDHELLLRNFDAGDERLPALIEPLAGGKKKVDFLSLDHSATGGVRKSALAHLRFGVARCTWLDSHGAGVHGTRAERGDRGGHGHRQERQRAGRRLSGPS
jgi:hypothetical protein